MVHTAAAEASLRDGEGLSLSAEQVVGGHPYVVVVDEGVHTLVLVLPTEAYIADDLDSGRVGRHQEHRRTLVDADVGVGDGHHDEEGRRPGIGGEELPAVDDPLVAVTSRRDVNCWGSDPA